MDGCPFIRTEDRCTLDGLMQRPAGTVNSGLQDERACILGDARGGSVRPSAESGGGSAPHVGGHRVRRFVPRRVVARVGVSPEETPRPTPSPAARVATRPEDL